MRLFPRPMYARFGPAVRIAHSHRSPESRLTEIQVDRFLGIPSRESCGSGNAPALGARAASDGRRDRAADGWRTAPSLHPSTRAHGIGVRRGVAVQQPRLRSYSPSSSSPKSMPTRSSTTSKGSAWTVSPDDAVSVTR